MRQPDKGSVSRAVITGGVRGRALIVSAAPCGRVGRRNRLPCATVVHGSEGSTPVSRVDTMGGWRRSGGAHLFPARSLTTEGGRRTANTERLLPQRSQSPQRTATSLVRGTTTSTTAVVWLPDPFSVLSVSSVAGRGLAALTCERPSLHPATAGRWRTGSAGEHHRRRDEGYRKARDGRTRQA